MVMSSFTPMYICVNEDRYIHIYIYTYVYCIYVSTKIERKSAACTHTSRFQFHFKTKVIDNFLLVLLPNWIRLDWFIQINQLNS